MFDSESREESSVKETIPETEDDSDDDVFHDARFPAEEEAVSCTCGTCRESTLIKCSIMTEAFEGVTRH